jgi:hypothetical protein
MADTPSRKTSQKFDVIATLTRTHFGQDCTLGQLHIEGASICTLEPPWRNNESNQSCIPPGVYTVNYLNKSASGKYRDVYHVTGVDGRHGVLIHKGNTVNQTKGCILVGLRTGRLMGERAVLNSKSALGELHKITGRESFTLIVENGYVVS